jgi:MYXO-CTERM domain-containing protein
MTMNIRKAMLVAALTAAPFAVQATETVHTDQTAFNAAVAAGSDNTASDNFADIAPGLIDTTAGAFERTVTAASGTLDYTVDAPNGIFVVDVDADPTDAVVVPALSTNELTDSLFFSGFTNVNAIGGTFFNTDPDGVSVLSDLLLEIDLGGGNLLSYTLAEIASPTFWGITLSEGYIQSLTVTNALADAFPTIGQLFFGSLAPTVVTPPTPTPGPTPTPAPAPAVFALLLAGLAGAAALRRRAA